MAMNDDDGIEFIGFKPPVQQTTSPTTLKFPTNSFARTVTGIALHIDSPVTTNSTNPQTLTFHKAHSPSVEIGRLPGPDAPGKYVDGDDKKALFRCPVVSRRHAKIAFSDSGLAYIIDLTSHHGTYLRSPSGQTEKLEPEVPALLEDGSYLTLGKAVGKGVDLVHPVVIRVELLHSQLPFSFSSSSSSITASTSIKRQGTGRYGAPLEVSDDSESSNSGSERGVYSDVEEIPPPIPRIPIPMPSPVSAPSESQNQSSSSLGRALEVLKKLMPPTHTPTSSTPPQAVSPSFQLSFASPPMSTLLPSTSSPIGINNSVTIDLHSESGHNSASRSPSAETGSDSDKESDKESDRRSYSPAYSPNWSRVYDDALGMGYFPEIEYYDEPVAAAAAPIPLSTPIPVSVPAVPTPTMAAPALASPVPSASTLSMFMPIFQPCFLPLPVEQGVQKLMEEGEKATAKDVEDKDKDKDRDRDTEIKEKKGKERESSPTDSNMDLETPAPASRSPSRSSSRSRSASCSDEERERSMDIESDSSSESDSCSDSEDEEEDDGEDEEHCSSSVAGSRAGSVTDAVSVTTSRDKANANEDDRPIHLDDDNNFPNNDNNNAEDNEEDADGEASDADSEESVSTSFDPFASFHVGQNKDWICSPAFEAASVTFDEEVSMSIPVTAHTTGNTTNVVSSTTTPTTTGNNASASASNNKTSITVSGINNNNSASASTSNAYGASKMTAEEAEAEAEANTLPPIKSSTTTSTRASLPSLAKMRFMGMGIGMGDVLNEASVWKFGVGAFGRKDSNKDSVKDIKEEKEKKEEVKEKEKKEKDKEDKRAEEEELEGEEDAEGDVDDEMEDVDADFDVDAEGEDYDEEVEEDLEVEKMKEEIEKIQAELQKLNTHRRKYKYRFNSNVRAVEEKFNALNTKLDNLTASTSSSASASDLNDLKKELKEFRDTCLNLEDRVEGLSDDVWDHNRRLEDAQDAHEDKIASMREEMMSAKDDMLSAQNELSSTRSEIDSAVNDLYSAREDLADARKELFLAQTNFDTARDNAERMSSTYREEIGSLKMELGNVQGALGNVQSSLVSHELIMSANHRHAVTCIGDVMNTVRNSETSTRITLEEHAKKLGELEAGCVEKRRVDELESVLRGVQLRVEDALARVQGVELVEERLSDVERSVEGMNLDGDERMNEIVKDVVMMEMGGRVEELEKVVGERREADDALEREKEDAVRELKALVTEMRQLRDETQKQMALDLQSVKAAKEVAMMCISKNSQVQAQVRIPPSHSAIEPRFNLCEKSSSLKRKRDGEEESDENGNENRTGDASALSSVGDSASSSPSASATSSSAQDAIMGDLTLTTPVHASLGPEEILGSNSDLNLEVNSFDKEEYDKDIDAAVAPPPRKRARKVVNVLAQTAGALTVGAVATWTALAFS